MSLRPGRSYLVGEAKNRGGDGHREPPALPGGRGRELTGTEGGGGGGKSAGPGSCAAPGASQRGCGGRNRHRKLQTLPNAPAIPARRGGGGRLGSGVSPRHPSKRGRGRSAALPQTPAGTPEQRAKGEGGSKSSGGAAGAPRTATQVHRSVEGSGQADGGAGRPPASLRRHRRDPQRTEAPLPYCRSREWGELPVPGPPRSPAGGSQGHGARRGSGTR